MAEEKIPRIPQGARFDWASLRIWHLGLAFFWATTMLTFRSSVLLCTCLDTKLHTELTSYVGLSAQTVMLLTVVFFMYFRPTLAQSLPGGLFVSLLVTGLFTLSIGGHGNQSLATATSVIGSLLCGVGFGYFCGMWAQVYGQMHPSRTSFYVPLSFVLSFIIFFVVLFLGDTLEVQAALFVIPLPILSLIFLKKCQTETDVPEPTSATSVNFFDAFRSLWPLLLGMALFSFVLGVSWQLSASFSETANQTHFLPLLVSFGIGALYTASVALLRRRINLSSVYRLALLAFLCVFALMPLLYDQNPTILFSVADAAYVLFDIIVWCMVTEQAYDYRVPGFVIGGTVRGLAIFFRLTGLFVGGLIVSTAESPQFFIIVISLAALYISAMWIIAFLVREKLGKKSGLRAQDTPASKKRDDLLLKQEQDLPILKAPETRFKKKCALVTEEYRLTRRESDVLPYLAQGRSAKYIANELFISENTVRSHISSILSKTNTHTKDSIIDIVECAK